MTDESRKHFEAAVLSGALFPVTNIRRNWREVRAGDYENMLTNVAWITWRKAHNKPKIKFPDEIELELNGDEVVFSHQNAYADGYNRALKDLELICDELGYEVE